MKLIPFVAGACRHSDWFLDLADYLVLQPDRVPYNAGQAAWLIPELHTTKSPGTTLGNWIKALIPVERGGPGGKFGSLDMLPADATAGGCRPGAGNELAPVVPGDFIWHCTGHDMRPGLLKVTSPKVIVWPFGLGKALKRSPCDHLDQILGTLHAAR